MTADRPTTLVDATADDALGSDDVTALLERLGRREVCGAELRDAAVARVRTVNDHLNAVTCWVDEPSADGVPAHADAPLAGIPTVMVFVQSLRGLSHTKLEDTKREHLELSVAALDRLASKTIASLAV